MKFPSYAAFAATFLSFAGMAFGDDTPSAQPVKSPQQKMHECIAQQRANNGGMSKEDMKKACVAKLQSDENHPSHPQPAPDPTPN
jgi:hypothetical protein